ncbi:hypothetical protein IV203_038391 [Nitzschia inconspicua]|uniref:C2H2-type domain-containing protein n=1 Tax=Nitzschia inconspicua TaxID=303405 RepID=A0A9K3PZ83_9STRA|nr:hypothetical protein IV203_038391 [Nitzschia inconspicua]
MSSFPCQGCGESFPSRNAVFKHLKETDGACLDSKDRHEFLVYVRRTEKLQKVILLYGYLPFDDKSFSNLLHIHDGQDAGRILMETISEWQNSVDGISIHQQGQEQQQQAVERLNRSYGNSSKNCADCVQQDPDTGAISEVMTARLHRLRGGISEEQWLDQIQSRLDAKYQRQQEHHQQQKDCARFPTVAPIRILGRLDMPHASFNAERDVTFRRIEYILPLDFLAWGLPDDPFREKVLQWLPAFAENHKHDLHHVDEEAPVLEPDLLQFMIEMKNVMKQLRTHIVTVNKAERQHTLEEKNDNTTKNCKAKGPRKSKEFQSKGKKHNSTDRSHDKLERDAVNDATIKELSREPENKSSNGSNRKRESEKKHYLKRKRFHNFTEKVMAHEFLAYRRLDRMYHRATLELPKDSDSRHKYVILSLSADIFLTGQVQRMVGVFLALMNRVIDADFIDCVFDDEYPHLIATPPAPPLGVIAADAHYVNMEGKTKRILSPRMSNEYNEGFNQKSTLLRVKDWQETIYDHIAKEWEAEGRDPQNGRLIAEQTWTETVLKPWAEKARLQLNDYRRWKQSQLVETDGNVSQPLPDDPTKLNPRDGIVPDIKSVDPSVPEAYEKVLRCLREVDASGKWPTTTPKRQLVMVSTGEGEGDYRSPLKADTLSVALLKARINTVERSSAYSFVEGQGGASGSFSVGYMPGGVNKTPKANSLFPELVQAAFELERVLCPDREPSSTIAINRNAQFRPHTDSGAGAGQSTSLIVGLGTYTGGELMVEGVQYDIRYKAIEFNGWKQRHWTMPFCGERYSLVWFTPKGCEGRRGIDLQTAGTY